MTGAATTVCLVTAPPADAERIARALVERRLAACVNAIPLVRSTYRWEGEVRGDDESLLLVKTTRSALAGVERLLEQIHPYDTFELVALDAAGGSERYLRWIADSTSAPGQPRGDRPSHGP